jgi:hypothetical protein
MSLFTLRPPSKKYVPDNDDRLAAVGEHLLALLAEPPDELADLVACCGRRPPTPGAGGGWHSWTRLRPRLTARAGMVGKEARVRQIQQWSAWKLATAGKIELAATPQRGQCGRIRFARIAPPAPPMQPASAHEWAVRGSHAEAARA